MGSIASLRLNIYTMRATSAPVLEFDRETLNTQVHDQEHLSAATLACST